MVAGTFAWVQLMAYGKLLMSITIVFGFLMKTCIERKDIVLILEQHDRFERNLLRHGAVARKVTIGVPTFGDT